MSAVNSVIMTALRGLAVCPECGGPATFSVHPDGLAGWACARCLGRQGGIKCEMKCAECARAMCTGARKLAEEAGEQRAEDGDRRSEAGARTGKAGRVIGVLSCGATLREMTPDLAAGTAEREAGGGSGEGAGGVGKGWVLVCSGRCVDRHGLACAERVREALDAKAVRGEQEDLPARTAQQDADLRDGHGDEAGVGDLDAEPGIAEAGEPPLDVDAKAGAVLGEGAPRVQEPQASAQQGYRERDVFAGDPYGYREDVHGHNRSTGAGGAEGGAG